MSLYERFDLEEGKMDPSDFLLKNCGTCKYWTNLVSHKMEYCHKCINNPKISIRSGLGYTIETLYDYYTPIEKGAGEQTSKEPYEHKKSCVSGKF